MVDDLSSLNLFRKEGITDNNSNAIPFNHTSRRRLANNLNNPEHSLGYNDLASEGKANGNWAQGLVTFGGKTF